MRYADLDINQKINVKAELKSWARYAVDHFKTELDQKVYGLRQTKRGIQRSSLIGYRFGSGKSRTNALRKTWYQNVSDSAGMDKVMIQFLLYGRFLDMGVGRGTSHTRRVVDRSLRMGRSARTRRAWYSKRKAYEVHRLNEILQKRNLQHAFAAVENPLNISVYRNL